MNRLLLPIFLSLFFFGKSAAQDTLIFEGKWPYLVHIERETETKVFYKKLDKRDKYLHYIEKRFVTQVNYTDPSRRKVESEPIDARPLDVWVKPMGKPAVQKGSLLALNDTTLFLRKKEQLVIGKKKVDAQLVKVFPYDKIEKIQIAQRNQVRNYALVGAAGGFAIGFLTGLATFRDSPPCDSDPIGGRDCDGSLSSPKTAVEKSLLLGVGGAGGGLLAGGIYGTAVRVKIPINGKRYIFNEAIPRMRRLAWQQQQDESPIIKVRQKKRKNKD